MLFTGVVKLHLVFGITKNYSTGQIQSLSLYTIIYWQRTN